MPLPKMQFTEDDFERNWYWIGIDQRNRIGLFQSFGDGVVPKSVAESIEHAEFVQDYILDRMLVELSGFCDGKLISQNVDNVPVRPKSSKQSIEDAKLEYQSSIKMDAACGLFIFNAELSNRRPVGYQMLAYPSKGRLLTDLPECVAIIVQKHRLTKVDFERTDRVSLVDFDW